MSDKAYEYMDWRAMEGVIYSDEHFPKSVLGPQSVKNGTLYQCFIPGAEHVWLKETRSGRRHKMTMEDEKGWFACVLPSKKVIPHIFLADGEDKGDPYAFDDQVTPEEEARFGAGIASRIYRKLGAHLQEIDGQKGVLFAVWAPNAMRVSVVGPFNNWDGRVNLMELHEESGIFELFIPFLKAGTSYQYELKLKDGTTYTRPDPYGTEFRMTEEKVFSVVSDLSYHWHDRSYLEKRSEVTDTTHLPMAILECSLPEWKKKTKAADYRELAERIAEYASEYGYTHVELMPVMEYPDDASNGYQTGGYYAPTGRFGKPADFKYFVDRLHRDGIGVILDWTPSQFSSDERWLADFDGTGLYEHHDPRQGIHPQWGSKIYNYGRPEVRSFLLSNADFWMREYHADGLRIDGASTMLRLDWGRRDWIPNMYGSYENLDGIEFLKNLSTVFKKTYPDGLLILEEDTDWPDITSSVEDGGLGFDYKWNVHFTQDMLEYMSKDSYGRQTSHELLMNGMLHNYLDHFIISLSRGIGTFDPEQFENRITGTKEQKMALLRAVYGYLFLHPGKKLLTMGEAFDDKYLKALLQIYRTEPTLWAHDYEETGFEWINTMDDEHSVLSFARRGNEDKDLIVAVCNFSDEDFAQYQIGVPCEGIYTEILNSDDRKYGGSGEINPRSHASRKEEFDEREDSLRIRLAPRSIAVFRLEK